MNMQPGARKRRSGASVIVKMRTSSSALNNMKLCSLIAQNVGSALWNHRSHWDEAAYRWFYRDTNGPLWDRLRPELNWKPYWGKSDQANIILSRTEAVSAIMS